MQAKTPIIVGITGASGAVLALNAVDELLARDVPTVVVCSNSARLVWQDELGVSFNDTLVDWQENPSFTFYPVNDMRAPIASGTYPTRGMAIVPASMNTVASIAHGVTHNLIHRAADVCLKERRRLVLVPRETPFSAIHLEHMLSLTRMGAVILPAAPGFYHQPTRIDDLIDFIVARILNQLGIEHRLMPRWGE